MDKQFSSLLDVDIHYSTALEKLFSALMPLAEKKRLKRNDVFLDFKQDDEQLLLIETGNVGYYRKSDRLLIHETQAPAILGLAHAFQKVDVIAQAHTSMVVGYISRETALKIIDQKGLWREVAVVLGRIIKGYMVRDTNMVAQDAYHIVKHHLGLLMALTIEDRYAITAAKFITSRTMLSRSRVMEILKQLGAGNYITIKNGILVSIEKLPDKF
ncbi:helix-turn-helix domain-containing protein [Buttiauxella brennerae]|nr:helix-turn-helix domain-containing protein [Buttiauxella brennerae]